MNYQTGSPPLGQNRLINMSSIDPIVNGTKQQSSVPWQNVQSSIPVFNFSMSDSMSDSRKSTAEPNASIFVPESSARFNLYESNPFDRILEWLDREN